ncbi:MAG: hypothetical protein GY745_19235 [Actinomycetia bacterium]|nr:hypothetical protein [Actinomycetes bacterium]
MVRAVPAFGWGYPASGGRGLSYKEIADTARDQSHHHLDSCGHCASAHDFEAELRQVIASRCVDRAPECLRRRILDALGEDPR